MSCVGETIGSPFDGESRLLTDRASAPRLGLRRARQRHVDRHLVAVEVRVERRADQRVNLDRRALDQHGLERLDAEPVQRRGAVEQHQVVLDDLFQHVPDAGSTRSTSRLAALMLCACP